MNKLAAEELRGLEFEKSDRPRLCFAAIRGSETVQLQLAFSSNAGFRETTSTRATARMFPKNHQKA